MIIRHPLAWWVGALCALIPAATATATITLPAIFGEHMVLQQDLKLRVWGTADPGEVVFVSISAHHAEVIADQNGKWRADLDPLPATTQPVELHVVGNSNSYDFKDVLIGDVWVCSGQSNMEFGIKIADNSKEAIASANQPEIRLFLVTRNLSLTPLPDCSGQWMVCNPETLVVNGWNGFSAAAYFFGKEIHEDRKVPIGLIDTSWGGSPAQSWTNLDALLANPILKPLASGLMKTSGHLRELWEKYQAETVSKWQTSHDAWDAEVGVGQRAALEQWNKDVAQAKAAGQPAPEKPKPSKPEPSKPAFFADNSLTPTGLYNAMIHPLIPIGIKGVIWYQGESNAGSVDAAKQYATLFSAMITGWRKQWGLGDFPFIYVQLAGFAPGNTTWPYVRDSQTQTLATVPATGMAVALDIGNEHDVHPVDKVDVGHRLALAARHVAYGEKLVYSGPMYAGMKAEGPEVRVFFNERGSALVIGVSPARDPKGQKAVLSDHLEGFEVAGADGNFVPATARIDGDTVIVAAPGVTTPTAVRYGWKGFLEANLYNQEGLPACPFSSLSTPIIP